MADSTKVRIDKWLWAVRAYKTRSLATDACAAGRVKMDGNAVKPARHVNIGETVSYSIGPIKKIWKVLKLIDKRVSAPLAQACYEDLSPPPPLALDGSAFIAFPQRDRGEGRPTKRERRDMDKFRG